MSLFTDIAGAYQLWQQYGPTAEKSVAVIGEIIDAIEPVLLKNGIDLSAALASATGAIDLTSIRGIQSALNKVGAAPQVQLTGVLDSATQTAIGAFQAGANLAVDYIPGPATIAALNSALTAALIRKG